MVVKLFCKISVFAKIVLIFLKLKTDYSIIPESFKFERFLHKKPQKKFKYRKYNFLVFSN